jgi:hypothetical protein
VPCEGGLLLLRRERLEVQIESGCVPVAPEVIDGLRAHHRADGILLRRQPRAELAFRPEGRDVGSREPYVSPEPHRRHEEVNDRATRYTAVFDVKPDGLPGLWRVRLESPVADKTENGKPVPDTVRVPREAHRVHHEMMWALTLRSMESTDGSPVQLMGQRVALEPLSGAPPAGQIREPR